MAKYVPKILEPVLNYTPSTGVENAVSYASKAMRAKIIYDRYNRGYQKADTKAPKDAYDNEVRGVNHEPAHRELIPERDKPTGYIGNEELRLSRAGKIAKDYISIIDLDFNPSYHDESRYYSYLQLPFVPRELNYQPDSNFVGIASFGSNNPIYQFTGSEDTLSFEIDWFSQQENRQDVIFNCRWMEALTKADSYDEAPHRVKIVWGGGNSLFDDAIWVLVAAPYSLSQFNRGYMSRANNFISTDMLPQQAYQSVTFKRVTTHNRSSKEIIGNLYNRNNESLQ